jgi:hypothetical protein
MNPYLTRAAAETRITDLHREAAQRRSARTAAFRPASRRPLRDAWTGARTATTGWLSARSVAAQGAPVCCPA